MKLLENVIQPYAWGSRTAIPKLMGRSPSEAPEAELWMGAHPGAPSRIEGRSLGEHIAADPHAALGAAAVARWGPELPFLLKVLAAGEPLSLQTHPSLTQAKEGFAREEAAGIPRSAPHRNYKDANHKPELICALTPFDALCGFRDAAETLALFEALQVDHLAPLLAPLRASVNARGIRGMFEGLMAAERGAHAELVAAVVDACAASTGPFAAERGWAVKLAALYPGDPGVLGALMLNLVQLQPLEAIYLPAGNLHAYLSGLGVEIMASSDNVLRGGCTPKHVDARELLRVLDFKCGPIPLVHAEATPEGEELYATPTEEFRLSRVQVAPGHVPRLSRRGAEILLCTEGEVTVRAGTEALTLRSGQSTFLGAADPEYGLDGTGVLFRASAGLANS